MGMDQSGRRDDVIILYGTEWCSDCMRSRRFLDRKRVPYRWVDIDKDAEAGAFVERANRGYRSVPTIVFPDGGILVEPSDAELAASLGTEEDPSQD